MFSKHLPPVQCPRTSSAWVDGKPFRSALCPRGVRRGGVRHSGVRRGQAMIEFAIISFMLTSMLAAFLGLIVLGLGSFQNQLAAESAGRILDQTLPADLTSSTEVYEALAENELYDEQYLIIEKTNWFDADFRSALPEINRSLLGSYIYDPDLDAYRYPGAVVTNAQGKSTVLIPLLRDNNPPIDQGIDRAMHVAIGDTPVSDDWVGRFVYRR